MRGTAAENRRRHGIIVALRNIGLLQKQIAFEVGRDRSTVAFHLAGRCDCDGRAQREGSDPQIYLPVKA